VIGLVVTLQTAVNAAPPSTLKLTAPVGTAPLPVQITEALNAELLP
jgi:hypothetical protein